MPRVHDAPQVDPGEDAPDRVEVGFQRVEEVLAELARALNANDLIQVVTTLPDVSADLRGMFMYVAKTGAADEFWMFYSDAGDNPARTKLF